MKKYYFEFVTKYNINAFLFLKSLTQYLQKLFPHRRIVIFPYKILTKNESPFNEKILF
jgi:hypothetical protein